MEFKKAIFLSISFSLTALSTAHSDALEDCLDIKEKENTVVKNFTQPGEVTCPAGDVVGFPPRSRKHNRSGTVTFRAPDGYKILNVGVGSVRINNISSNQGTYGQLSISQNNTVASVSISCNGKSPGQGRSWQKVEIVGQISKSPAPEDYKKWVLECAKAIG